MKTRITLNLKNKKLAALLLSVLAILLLTNAKGQFPGQENDQYKIQNRDAISNIVDGKADTAISHFEQYLKSYPGDLESLYGLVVAHTQKNDIATAISYVKQAIDAGLPFERFLAGPRDLLKPLVVTPDFRALAEHHARERLHGPLLSNVTANSAQFWIRTAHEVEVQVIVSNTEDLKNPISSAAVKTSEGRDFTAVVSVQGLMPEVNYFYQLLIDGKKETERWSFRTFPATGKKAVFQIGFGGGAGYTPWHEYIWKTIASYRLPAFLQMGDNVYIDNPTRQAVQQYCYYRRQSRPEYQAFSAATSIFSIWDDHDFTIDDGRGGPETFNPPWKLSVWKTFRNNWNNPDYGGGENQPGCWYNFSIGDVEFFMLDGRYYRSDPEGPAASMLGPVQKLWLLEKLKASKATFKIIASPVPWANKTKPGSGSLDTWEGYQAEREEIFSFLEKNKIDGVCLLSADRHRSDAWKIERPQGYDLYDFMSSRLTNVHTHPLMEGSLFGYNDKCSFGLLAFDTTKKDPEITYKIVSIDNEIVHSFTLKKSQLTRKR